MKDPIVRSTLSAYLLALAGLVALTAITYVVSQRKDEAADLVARTEKVIAENRELGNIVLNAESNERAYLLTGIQEFVSGYHVHAQAAHQKLAELRTLTRDNAVQQKNLAALSDVIQQKFDLVEARLYLRDKISVRAATESAMRSEGREDMELIRARINKIEKEERRLLAMQQAELDTIIRRLDFLRGVTVVFSVVLLSALFWNLLLQLHRRREIEARVAQFAYEDALTGLPNRRLLIDRINQYISAAKRNQNKLAVLFLDLDGFKAVNDNHGHDAGDALLRVVAARLSGALRNVDTVARLGGDEFVIALMRIEQDEDVAIVAQKVIDALQVAVRLPECEVQVGTSVGISIFPRHGGDPESLLSAADKALYQAKRAGKGRFAVFDGVRTSIESDAA